RWSSRPCARPPSARLTSAPLPPLSSAPCGRAAAQTSRTSYPSVPLSAVCAVSGRVREETKARTGRRRSPGGPYPPGPSASILAAGAQHREKRLLWDLDFAHFLHPALALFLLLEELLLARDVAAIALGGDVLAQRLDRDAGDDLGADRRL